MLKTNVQPNKVSKGGADTDVVMCRKTVRHSNEVWFTLRLGKEVCDMSVDEERQEDRGEEVRYHSKQNKKKFWNWEESLTKKIGDEV